jgi:acyl-CoA thioester hydrolase
VVRTWVAGFQKVTSLRKYQILRTRDEALLAVAETNWAFVSLQTRQPRRIPRELMAAFEVVSADA